MINPTYSFSYLCLLDLLVCKINERFLKVLINIHVVDK